MSCGILLSDRNRVEKDIDFLLYPRKKIVYIELEDM